jgi:hypothetical protein
LRIASTTPTHAYRKYYVHLTPAAETANRVPHLASLRLLIYYGRLAIAAWSGAVGDEDDPRGSKDARAGTRDFEKSSGYGTQALSGVGSGCRTTSALAAGITDELIGLLAQPDQTLIKCGSYHEMALMRFQTVTLR